MTSRVRILRLLAICGLVWGATLSTQELHAQIRTIPRSKLDSVSNPSVADGGSAMIFKKRSINAGTFKESDGVQQFSFEWSNAGTTPLVITKVVTNCSCTKISYSRQPVKAGEGSTLAISYDPKGRIGEFNRKVFVYTQLSSTNPTAILSFYGTTTGEVNTSAEFPVSAGPLMMSRKVVIFDKEKLQQSAIITCMNAASTPLKIDCDRNMLPPGFDFEISPTTLQPGEKGEIKISFNPKAAGYRARNQSFVTLTGLNTPASQSTIRVIIE